MCEMSSDEIADLADEAERASRLEKALRDLLSAIEVVPTQDGKRIVGFRDLDSFWRAYDGARREFNH